MMKFGKTKRKLSLVSYNMFYMFFGIFQLCPEKFGINPQITVSGYPDQIKKKKDAIRKEADEAQKESQKEISEMRQRLADAEATIARLQAELERRK